jgi:putative phage-type endonuclease
MNAQEQWLKNRMTGIGGSDAAAILGASRFKSAVDVWMDKTGQAEPIEDNAPMLWGRTLEPVIRAHYCAMVGKTVLQPAMMRHPVHNFMLANLDGMVMGDRVLEIKTARTADGWGDPGSDEIPLDYAAQVHHYMIVTGLPRADVAVLIGGSDFRIYTVYGDAELHDAMIEKEREFWRLVETNTMPEPQSGDDALKLFAKDNGASMEADDILLDDYNKLKSLREERKQVDARIEEVEDYIKRRMGEAAALAYNGQTLATWKAAKDSSKFDADAFKAAHPDLFQQYQKTQAGSRRFLIK